VEGWRIALLAAGLLYLYPFIGAVLAMERPRHRRVGAVACALLALLMVGAAFCFRNGPDGAAGPTYWFGSDTVFMVAVVMFMQYALLVGAGYVAGRIADMRDLRRSMPRLAACVALVCIAHFPLSHVV
jgi:hypothetical protein